MLRHLWLIFAQTATVCIAVWFVVATLKPAWLPGDSPAAAAVTVTQAPPAPAAASAEPVRIASFSEAARKAMPAVVNIFTSKDVKVPKHPLMNDPLFRHFFGREPRGKGETRRSSSLGSGVIVSAQGYILTNFHVIESADEIEVLLSDNRKVKATIVGGDPETDLAVVKIDVPDIPAIVFGRPETDRKSVV